MIWEYRIITAERLIDNQREQLGEMGIDGWELIAVAEGMLYFKRLEKEGTS